MGCTTGNTDTDTRHSNRKRCNQCHNQAINITKREWWQEVGLPAMEHVRQGSKQRRHNDQSARVANSKVNRKAQSDNHEWYGNNTSADTVKRAKDTAGKT